jgi:hypothetical protein
MMTEEAKDKPDEPTCAECCSEGAFCVAQRVLFVLLRGCFLCCSADAFCTAHSGAFCHKIVTFVCCTIALQFVTKTLFLLRRYWLVFLRVECVRLQSLPHVQFSD